MKHFIVLATLLIVSSANPVSDEAGPQKLLQLAQANDKFGLKLLHQLEQSERAQRATKGPQNVFISPFSVSSVLSMLMAGGANTTYQEIRNTLGFAPTLTESEIYSSYETLNSQLKTIFSASSKNELKTANSIALQNKLQLLQSYLDVNTKSFDSKIFTVDFATKAHQATEDINKWVKEKTNGKIEKLFNEDLSVSTVMVLLNAIYFKGSWQVPFDKERTATGDFKVSAEQTVQVPMMSLNRKNFRYAKFDDGQLLELPYEGQTLSMLIFLPAETTTQSANVESLSSQFAALDQTKLATRIAALRNVTVNVQIPKFKIESSFALKSTLKAMGINEAFGSGADFSRINGATDLVLAEVMHKTYLEVNEEGSVAAATTGAVINKKSGLQPNWFAAIRPFVFLIRDNERQLTLFAGVVNKP